MWDHKTGVVVPMVAVGLACATPVPWLSAAFAAVGLFALAHREKLLDDSAEMWLAAVGGGLLIVSSLLAMIGPGPSFLSEAQTPWAVVALASFLVLWLFGDSKTGRRAALLLAGTAFGLVTVGVLATEWRSDRVGIDVYTAHLAAGTALRSWVSPYGDAVEVESTNPYAPEGSTLPGYPYPPIVALTYGGMAVVVDPRLVSALAMLAVIGGMVWVGERTKSDRATAAAVLLATFPAWPVILYKSWVEPLSLALLAGAGLAWRRKWLGPVLLGLALASKQYFVVVVPLVLLHGGWSLRRRLASLGTAAAAVATGLLFGSERFVTAAILEPLRTEFRPDTQSLPGLLHGIGISTELVGGMAAAGGLVAALLVARVTVGYGDFMRRAALTLGLTFFLGLAFPNYWFLVLGMIGLSTLESGDVDIVSAALEDRCLRKTERLRVPRVGPVSEVE